MCILIIVVDGGDRLFGVRESDLRSQVQDARRWYAGSARCRALLRCGTAAAFP